MSRQSNGKRGAQAVPKSSLNRFERLSELELESIDSLEIEEVDQAALTPYQDAESTTTPTDGLFEDGTLDDLIRIHPLLRVSMKSLGISNSDHLVSESGHHLRNCQRL